MIEFNLIQLLADYKLTIPELSNLTKINRTSLYIAANNNRISIKHFRIIENSIDADLDKYIKSINPISTRKKEK